MKYLLFITVFFAIDAGAQNDSTRSVDLSEVEVVGNSRMETSEKTILVPTSLEKNHSSSAFDLLRLMNIADLDVSPFDKTITPRIGGEVILCINGIESTIDEITTLRSKEVLSIEYIRHPTGKYAGKAALLNYKTIQYKYGGNAFLSALNGFTYKNGEYLASADYAREDTKFSLTYSNLWSRDTGYGDSKDRFFFTDSRSFSRESHLYDVINKQMDNTLNLRITKDGESSRLSILFGGLLSDNPYKKQKEDVKYLSDTEETQTINKYSDSKDLSSWLNGNYTLWMENDQIIDLTLISALGKNKYNNSYEETPNERIVSNVSENNFHIALTAQYYKTFSNGSELTSMLNHYYKRYSDHYAGNLNSTQTLRNNYSQGTIQLSKATEKIYWYANLGLVNMNVVLNDIKMNYCYPTGYYGFTFTPTDVLSLSLNGYYVNTIFNPENKNDLSLQTSPYEVMRGNPDLEPLKVLSHTFDANAVLGKSNLSLSYMYYIYFDNILHKFSVDHSYIYNMMVNDGNFYGHMLTMTYAQRLLNDKLRYSLTGIEEYNTIKGDTYNISRNRVRGKIRIDYILDRLLLSVNYTTPSTGLDIREPYIIRKKMNLGFQASWDSNQWHVEAAVNNPFTKYDKQTRYMDYGCYNMDNNSYTQSQGRNVILKLVYNIGYGKRMPKDNTSIERNKNSAILKSY